MHARNYECKRECTHTHSAHVIKMRNPPFESKPKLAWGNLSHIKLTDSAKAQRDSKNKTYIITKARLGPTDLHLFYSPAIQDLLYELLLYELFLSSSAALAL